MIRFHHILWVTLLLCSACSQNDSKQTSETAIKTAIELRNDTLLAITDRALMFTNGTSDTLPFTDDSTAILLIVVRHAEKATEGDDPILTPAGQARAAHLTKILKDCPLNGIYTTQFVRTMKTAQPVATAQQQVIMLYDHKDLEFAPRLLQKQQGKRLLIVGHSNSIPKLVNQIIGEDHFETIGDEDYSNVFVVAVGNNGQSKKVIRARF